MKEDYTPGTYEYIFGELSPEEKEQLIKDDIPTAIVIGHSELTQEQKERAERFLEFLRKKHKK